jgi:hypothetical protein
MDKNPIETAGRCCFSPDTSRCDRREKQRWPNLFRRLDQDSSPLRFKNRFRVMLLAFGEMTVAIFHHHDGGIDQDADGQCNAPKGHDVRCDS